MSRSITDEVRMSRSITDEEVVVVDEGDALEAIATEVPAAVPTDRPAKTGETAGRDGSVTLPALSEASSSRGDGLTEQRLRSGNPLLAARVVPSAAPLPLDAQRDFRGWIVLVILALVMLGVGLTVALVHRVAHRQVIYAPAAAKLTESGVGREPTAWETQRQALLVVQDMESWTPATAEKKWNRLVPFFHPSLHQRMEEHLADTAVTAERLWQHRVAALLGAASAGTSTEGIYTMAVFYDQIELLGRHDQERELQAIIPKAALLRFVQDQPTKENPLGLLLIEYRVYEQEAWEELGMPAMWQRFRAPAEDEP